MNDITEHGWDPNSTGRLICYKKNITFTDMDQSNVNYCPACGGSVPNER